MGAALPVTLSGYYGILCCCEDILLVVDIVKGWSQAPDNGDDQFEGLVIPVLGIEQGIFALDIKLIKIHIVQKHINAAKVIGGDVNLLPEEADFDCIFAHHLQRLQQQRTRTAGRVIDLVDLCLTYGAQPGQQFRHVSGGEELTTGLACVGGIHGHQVFVGITEGVNIMILYGAKVHVVYAIQQLGQALIPLGDGAAQLVAVDVEVIKEAVEVPFRGAALGGLHDMSEDLLQFLIQANFIASRVLPGFILDSLGTDIASIASASDNLA